MNWQDELQHDTGQIVEPGEHPNGCICTGCTTERELARGGRFDRNIATHLHHIKDLRNLRSAGAEDTSARRAQPEGVRRSPSSDRP